MLTILFTTKRIMCVSLFSAWFSALNAQTMVKGNKIINFKYLEGHSRQGM